jgi:pilus assembly protein CpaC
LNSSFMQKNQHPNLYKKLFLCRYAPKSFSMLVWLALLPISFSSYADSPTVVVTPIKSVSVTRCADPVNAANPDCQLGSVRYSTAAENVPAPRARAQRSLKVRDNKSIQNPPTQSPLQPVARQELVMYAGEVIVLDVGAVDRIALGNGKIASTSVVDKKRLLIIAQEVGDTNILLWDKSRLIGEIRLRVTAQNLERVKAEARNLLAEIPGLKINNVGDRIFVEGSDLTDSQLARVKVLAAQYPGIIDRTYGKLRPPVAADPSAMVMFDLYFVEFKKSYLQNLGVSWQKSANGFGFGVYGEAASGPLLLRPNVGAGGQSTLPDGRVYGLSTAANIALTLPATINLAVDSGDAILLAAPKIASRSGGKAKFTAGGEVPLPSTSQQGTSVAFKPYGILLEVEPQINNDGSVSGIVNAEVSAIDPGVTVMGIPGFLTRRTEANFHSRSGEAVVLSGLYSQELSKSTDKVPFLGDIPILRALFSSSNEARKNSELVVFIVPHVHSAGGVTNDKVLGNTRLMIEEQSNKLNGNDSDILKKLKMSPTLWGKDLLGGEAVGRPSGATEKPGQSSEPLVNIPLHEHSNRQDR